MWLLVILTWDMSFPSFKPFRSCLGYFNDCRIDTLLAIDRWLISGIATVGLRLPSLGVTCHLCSLLSGSAGACPWQVHRRVPSVGPVCLISWEDTGFFFWSLAHGFSVCVKILRHVSWCREWMDGRSVRLLMNGTRGLPWRLEVC